MRFRSPSACSGAEATGEGRPLGWPALAFLLALTIVRLVVAAATPLAPDEAYYWVWSRALQPGYLDHPPMVALWIRLGTAIAGETALGVRLLGPVAALAGSVLLADAAARLFPGRRLGGPAAILLNATLMLGAGAVTMTPDTPLLFFAVVALWALARVPENGRWWLVAGLSVGAALDSKYTGGLLGFGAALWLALTGRWRSLRTPWPWLGAGLAVVLFLPVIGWNAAHGWVSFIKQGGRTGNWAPQAAVQHVLELIGGQVGLATPVIAVLFAAGLWRCLRRRGSSALLLVALAVPGLLLFLEHAIGARVQANWLAILYPPLAIAGAAVGARWQRIGVGLGLGLTALVYVQAAAAPFALPRRLDPTLIRLAGWGELAQAADAMRRADGLAFLAAEEYSQASELAWWAPPGTTVLGAEARWQLFALPPATPATGVLLVSARRQEGPDPALWDDPVAIGRLVRGRGGVEAEAFIVYRARLRAGAPAAVLPRPGGK